MVVAAPRPGDSGLEADDRIVSATGDTSTSGGGAARCGGGRLSFGGLWA